MRQLIYKIMKNFIKAIRSSVYDPDFYKSLESKSTWSAFNYFIKLNVIVALIFSIGLAITIIPIVFVVTNESNVSKVIEFFPAELSIEIKNGQAISNISGPYIIPIKSKVIDQTRSKITQKNLITIDTTNPFDLEQFKSSDSMVYLSKDYFAYQENGGQIKIQPLKGIGDMTISKNSISSWVGSVIPYVRALLPLAIVCLIILSFLSLFIGNIIFTLIASLIVLVIEKVRKINVDFKSIFKKALHLVTAIVLLDLALFIFHFGSIWLVNIVLFLWLYYSNTKVVAK